MLQGGRQCNLFDIGFSKRKSADKGDTLRQHNLISREVLKCIITNTCDTIGNGEHSVNNMLCIDFQQHSITIGTVVDSHAVNEFDGIALAGIGDGCR